MTDYRLYRLPGLPDYFQLLPDFFPDCRTSLTSLYIMIYYRTTVYRIQSHGVVVYMHTCILYSPLESSSLSPAVVLYSIYRIGKSGILYPMVPDTVAAGKWQFLELCTFLCVSIH